MMFNGILKPLYSGKIFIDISQSTSVIACILFVIFGGMIYRIANGYKDYEINKYFAGMTWTIAKQSFFAAFTINAMLSIATQNSFFMLGTFITWACINPRLQIGREDLGKVDGSFFKDILYLIMRGYIHTSPIALWFFLIGVSLEDSALLAVSGMVFVPISYVIGMYVSSKDIARSFPKGFRKAPEIGQALCGHAFSIMLIWVLL